ncbi:uncharacterized protein LOC132305021 [Cornus florida]|uniref:uncharacterized protein LOC132305021 n=1 Tax=Cornus florida TaxID=4283 RepID=UPI0028999E16|nr:uncharacterized protein LOC132305021 [Cornus florida]
MYDVRIAFNVVKYDSFAEVVEAFGQYDPGMKPPSYHEVRVFLLRKELDSTNASMNDHREEWSKFGCSLMADGWTDKRGRTLLNFLVNSLRGTMFIESIDTSSFSKDGEKIFNLLNKFVNRIGVANVVQVVTNSESSNKYAGRMLEKEHTHLYWTPCATHCLNLMLEDIGKIPSISRTMKGAMELNSYIYMRPKLLNIIRHFTHKKELLRSAKTQFVTCFITLSSIHEQKNNLRKMFTSEEWSRNKWAKEQAGKRVTSYVLMSAFWNTIVFSLKVSSPLILVLRLVDGERKPPMGYIYAAMDTAKKAIAKSFGEVKDKYKEIFEITDKRWNVQLHRPLHTAGYYLNPEFFYSNSKIEEDEDIAKGLYECIARLVFDVKEQDKITEELSLYSKAEGLFGNAFAIRQRRVRGPANWWEAYGKSTKHLQKFAIKLHNKKRNRLVQTTLNDLVFIKYNRALRRRYNMRDTLDPILLDDINESNEWLTGRINDDSDTEDDLVFEDDSLTWGYVASVAVRLVDEDEEEEDEEADSDEMEEDPENYESFSDDQDDIILIDDKDI